MHSLAPLTHFTPLIYRPSKQCHSDRSGQRIFFNFTAVKLPGCEVYLPWQVEESLFDRSRSLASHHLAVPLISHVPTSHRSSEPAIDLALPDF